MIFKLSSFIRRKFLMMIMVFGFCFIGCGDLVAKTKGKETFTEVVYNGEKLCDSVLYALLISKGVKEPKIVLAQAKHETGNYKSRLCREGNNLFGIRYGKKYAHFKNIEECVDAYLNKIQYRWKEGKETYYTFLKRIGYARDPNYINKIKKTVETVKLV